MGEYIIEPQSGAIETTGKQQNHIFHHPVQLKK